MAITIQPEQHAVTPERSAPMAALRDSLVLGGRAIREALRTPDSLLPTMFIPLFFLVVNVGQAARIFPSTGTPFLKGQNYGAFQLPASLLLSASFGGAALYLVEEIEGGYFDKLRATPISRTALILGRLYAEFAKTIVVATVMVVLALAFGIRVKAGIVGFLVLVALVALWAMVFSGFMQLIALKTRSAAATQGASMIFFPLLFLTPNFVPRNQLSRPMEIAATINPVTYVMEAARSLILEGFSNGAALAKGFVVVAVTMTLMMALSVRMINRYD
jgi:ABC-2 type transport system permease protein